MSRRNQADEIWDAAVEECYPSGVATSMRKEVNGLVRDLKDLNATPAEIHRRAPLYRQYCEKHDLMFGLRGLVRRWDQFPPPSARPKSQDERDAEERRRDSATFRWRQSLAQQILDRHTEDEIEASWQDYRDSMGRAANWMKNRAAYAVTIAEGLEPGALSKLHSDKLDEFIEMIRRA